MEAGEFRDKKIVVMGLGRFGGGVGVTRWLAGQGARVLVTDQADDSALAASLEKLADLPIVYRLGGHHRENLAGCDLLVVNPAVKKESNTFFQAAREAGIPWTSEMNLFFPRCRAPIIGITGTSGKSTTTAMLHAVLEHGRQVGHAPCRRIWLGGNIGVSLLENLPDIQPDDYVVLELSSFQLEDLADVQVSPHIALLTNFSDNHLDRHGTMEAYLNAKLNIFRFQGPGDYAVVPEKFPALCRRVSDCLCGARLHTVGPVEDPKFAALPSIMRIPGRHNLENACAAYTLAELIGLTSETIHAGLAEFTGLEHRLEFVREIDGVKYFNDSKATTPQATVLALEAFDTPVILLAGGSDKAAGFGQLARAAGRSAKAVICYGATRERIAQVITEANGPSPRTTVLRAETLEAAFQRARGLAAPGDVVLLSPACASYDQFLNYEQRGRAFKTLVQGS